MIQQTRTRESVRPLLKTTFEKKSLAFQKDIRHETSRRTVLLIKQSKLFTHISVAANIAHTPATHWPPRPVYKENPVPFYKTPSLTHTVQALTPFFSFFFFFFFKSLVDRSKPDRFTQLDFLFKKKKKKLHTCKKVTFAHTHDIVLFMRYPDKDDVNRPSRPTVPQRHTPSCTSSRPF